MSTKRHLQTLPVKILTLTLASLLTGCSFLGERYGEHCKSRAYLRTTLIDYISKRFDSRSPVRVAIIPYSVPANLSAQSTELPGVGNQLAWELHAQMLGSGLVPIVEVFNRQDWPGKKDEFYIGNYGAITFARDAGYDFVVVGIVDSMTRLDTLSAHTKIIETDSGTTVYYGQSDAFTIRKDTEELGATFGIINRRPDMLYTSQLVERLARCINREIFDENNPKP